MGPALESIAPLTAWWKQSKFIEEVQTVDHTVE